jgi:hypothetical protein
VFPGHPWAKKGAVAQVIECLPRKCEALVQTPVPSLSKERRKEREEVYRGKGVIPMVGWWQIDFISGPLNFFHIMMHRKVIFVWHTRVNSRFGVI